MLIGVFDETHKKDGDPLTGIGGFLFDKDALLTIQQEPVFKNRNRRHGDLSKLLAKHRGVGFICTVSNNEFDIWRRSGASTALWFGKPHSLCLLYIVGMVKNYLDCKGSSEDVFYKFEDGADGKVQGETFLRRIWTNPDLRTRFHLNNYKFVAKKPSYISDLAHVLIYHWQKIHRDAEKMGKDEGEANKVIRLLFENAETPEIRFCHLSTGGFRTFSIDVFTSGIIGGPQ